MGDLQLPQPTRNARDVFEVTTALFEAIPGVSVLKKYTDIRLNRQLEEALNKLADEVKECGIDILSDKQFEYYLPSAYRFAEQVRLGEYEHNLRILRRILIHGIKAESTDTGKIGRHARQLEFLSEFEINLLSACFEVKKIQLANDNPEMRKERIYSGSIIEKISRFRDVNHEDIKAGLSILNSRGLLFPKGAATWDKNEEDYNLSPDGTAIISTAQNSEA